MRALLLSLLIVLTALAGCLGPEGELGPREGPEEGSTDRDAERAEFLADQETYCDDEESCLFWDDMYHQFVVYDLDTYEFDVVIIPSGTADTLSHTQAARQAVEAWGEGILELAQPWLAEAFRMDVYVLGEDIVPPEVLADPTIVVVLGGVLPTAMAGIGLEPVQFSCLILEAMGGGNGTQHAGGHHVHANHNGWNTQWRQNCAGTSFTCFAINVVGVIGDEMALYDLVAHEVGHCLGVGHVGDALDFRAKHVPKMDIMSYYFDADQVGCVSNMNVRTLEGVFAHLLDRPEEEWLPRGSYLEFDPLDYEQVECANPAAAA
jgi:hypothetical protein